MEEPSTAQTSAPSGVQPTYRILVVANETVAGQALLRAIESRLRAPETRVTVICPALTGRLRRWFSDLDRGFANASQRLDVSLAALAELGIAAEGHIGDSDPLQAIDDALRLFRVDEIVISTHPRGRSNWLERRVVQRAGDRFGLPITHVIVDLEREAEVVQALPQEAPL